MAKQPKHPEHTPLNLGLASFSIILVLALSIFALATQEQRISELSMRNRGLASIVSQPKDATPSKTQIQPQGGDPTGLQHQVYKYELVLQQHWPAKTVDDQIALSILGYSDEPFTYNPVTQRFYALGDKAEPTAKIEALRTMPSPNKKYKLIVFGTVQFNEALHATTTNLLGWLVTDPNGLLISAYAGHASYGIPTTYRKIEWTDWNTIRSYEGELGTFNVLERDTNQTILGLSLISQEQLDKATSKTKFPNTVNPSQLKPD